MPAVPLMGLIHHKSTIFILAIRQRNKFVVALELPSLRFFVFLHKHIRLHPGSACLTDGVFCEIFNKMMGIVRNE
ncbi:hypothetical protein CMV16_17470 [Peribacillus simplex]|nr:hypothetical protein CMV16_17470 [Peribacillus simplex]